MEDLHNLNNAIEGELQQAAKYIRSQHLRDLVHAPDRAALCLQFEDLTVDCTRQPITLKILEKLVMLAKAKSLPDLMDDLFAGKAINLSEGKPVTHCALRSPEYQSREDYKKRSSFVDSLRANESITTVVNLGIGGSDLGPAMVTQGLAGFHDGPALHFVGNVDPAALYDALAQCDPYKTLFIVTSKSFTTDDTLETLKDAIKWSGDMNKFIAITANESEASKYNIKHIIKFDKEIGGRYSIWSDISVPVFLDSTFEPDNFWKGGHQADLDLKNNKKYFEFVKTLSYSDIWLNNSENKTSRAVLSYSWKLRSFADYVQQLEMESLGKQPHDDSNFKKTGQIIFGGYGPTAQHSYFQLLHQGTQNICADIIASKEDLKSLAYAQAITQAKILSDGADDLLKAQEKINGNIPLNLFLLNKIDAYTLGYLIATWEHRTYITAAMLQINPYDQYGVSAGKIYTKKYLQDNGA